MGITAIVSGIFAVAKAVPYVAKLIDLIYETYIENEIKNIDQQRVTLNNKRSAVLKAIEKAETNEEVIALSVVLYDISNGIVRE